MPVAAAPAAASRRSVGTGTIGSASALAGKPSRLMSTTVPAPASRCCDVAPAPNVRAAARTTRMKRFIGPSLDRPLRAFGARGLQVGVDLPDDPGVRRGDVVLLARVGLEIVELERRVLGKADRFPAPHPG